MSHHDAPVQPALDDILIVAPTDALRASLHFLLEEESYRVTTAGSIDEAAAIAANFACSVVDHHALRAKPAHDIANFIRDHWPVVLLANGIPGVQLPDSFRVVTKPLLGAALSQAVREAVAYNPGHREARA